MAGKLMIPMVILANHLETAVQVPALNPDYQTALRSYLGKHSTPSAFNSQIMLKKGLHLHFVLPSAFKNLEESQDESGNSAADYPAVPDRYLVVRMYQQDGKIQTDCHVVESNFYSLDSRYADSITVPLFQDQRPRHRFRYMGRSYVPTDAPPQPGNDSGYFDRITAFGAGDPVFSAYYPSCYSVFGFYDDLKGVPDGAVLTYLVLGYYSNAENDPFHEVKTAEQMQEVLQKHQFSSDLSQGEYCDGCVLYGIAAGIDLSKEEPLPVGEINVGIGKSSAEALSSIISTRYGKGEQGLERFLTSIQYDTADEVLQPDGNFKIDDDIHLRGFNRIDPLESGRDFRLPKNAVKQDLSALSSRLHTDRQEEQMIGKQRRNLEYKKNTLYSLWELWQDAAAEEQPKILGLMQSQMQEIEGLRADIAKGIAVQKQNRTALDQELDQKKILRNQMAPQPFYQPSDPVIMLFGNGVKRTYAFGEDGRFEQDGALFCLSHPLQSDLSKDELLGYFEDLPNLSGYCEDFSDYMAMALLLDQLNLQPGLGIAPTVYGKYSPVMVNTAPEEKVTLLMQWQTAFSADYTDADPKKSRFVYGNTDYVYDGDVTNNTVYQEGVAVLTPHGGYNLQEKLNHYLMNHGQAEQAAQISEKIRDIPAISQSLGGFQLSLNGLQQAFQFPVDIDPADRVSAEVAACLNPKQPLFEEPAAERIAVINQSEIYPLREGFFDLTKLALVTSFGEQRKLIDDDLSFKGTRYFSENLYPVVNNRCFFPLAFSSAARLSACFVRADDQQMEVTVLPDGSPILGIFLPDMLNRNLNVFSADGAYLGVIRTVYRRINGRKTALGRFTASPAAHPQMDSRIATFIASLTQENSAFEEVMAAIDQKLNATLPLEQNDFLFGRALVLAQASLQLEFYGGTEWSKKEQDIGRFDDRGLAKQPVRVWFGDLGRVTDGVCCGFSDGDFSRGFPAFGIESKKDGYLGAEPFYVYSTGEPRLVTLLMDPMLKVTVNTGVLPVSQIEMPGEHLDFAKRLLASAELNHVLSSAEKAQLPAFGGQTVYERYYPRITKDGAVYQTLEITSDQRTDWQDEGRMMTDGLIVERGSSGAG